MEVAVASFVTDRALLLVGVPGTANTWVSEHLAAAISGDSTLLVQGTAGMSEDALRYGWNYARLLAEGPSEAAMVPSPVMSGMQNGKLVRLEELTRIPSDVQDALITILSEKILPIPELNKEVQAVRGFNIIATANDRDKGVNELSSALRRRFNTVVLPLPATLEEEVRIVTDRSSAAAATALATLVGGRSTSRLGSRLVGLPGLGAMHHITAIALLAATLREVPANGAGRGRQRRRRHVALPELRGNPAVALLSDAGLDVANQNSVGAVGVGVLAAPVHLHVEFQQGRAGQLALEQLKPSARGKELGPLKPVHYLSPFVPKALKVAIFLESDLNQVRVVEESGDVQSQKPLACGKCGGSAKVLTGFPCVKGCGSSFCDFPVGKVIAVLGIRIATYPHQKCFFL